MRRSLTFLPFVLCVALASGTPAHGDERPRMFGNRGAVAPRAAAPAARSAGRLFGSGRVSSSSRAATSGARSWRSSTFSGATRSALSGSTSSRGATWFGNRGTTPRSPVGQVGGRTASPSASGAQRWFGGNRTPTARGTGSTSTAGTRSTGTLSPFARNLARSSSGTRFFDRGTATNRGTGSATTGTKSGVARSTGAGRVPGTTADRRTGFFRQPSTAATTGTRGAVTGARGTAAPASRRAASSSLAGSNHRRYGYTERSHSHFGRHHHHHGHHHAYYCSPFFVRSGFYLSFSFGSGPYFGLSYYYPWYHCGSSYAFFYSAPLTYCYVPYGFYFDAPATYVTRYVYVRDTYPTADYETVEAAPPQAEPTEDQKVVEPEPAAGSPVVEKYLRDASEAFRKADYLEAAKLFRLAALSAPDSAAPLFALSQALTALGSDAYAAKVLRKAVLLSPGLVKEPGDIVGVFKDQEEFDRVMGELQKRAEESPEGSDARFLLAAERYFSGDPKAVDGFAALRAALPGDPAVELFDDAARMRFAAADDLPPVAAEPK